MKLTAYVVDGHEVALRPAPHERDWMSATSERFAYRCLPLNIANAHGWEILCASDTVAVWDGGSGLDAIRVHAEDGRPPAAISHFGHGVLTFHVPIVFRTPPGVDLYVTGPINSPKDGIAPLTGIVETDWLPFSFTMNWLFTRSAQRVRFAAGEPFCHVFPVARGAIEAVEPEIAALSSDPDLKARHDAWAESRAAFNRDLADPQSQASLERWQKLYQRGRDAAGVPAGAAGHRTRLRARPFARR